MFFKLGSQLKEQTFEYKENLQIFLKLQVIESQYLKWSIYIQQNSPNSLTHSMPLTLLFCSSYIPHTSLYGSKQMADTVWNVMLMTQRTNQKDRQAKQWKHFTQKGEKDRKSTNIPETAIISVSTDCSLQDAYVSIVGEEVRDQH